MQGFKPSCEGTHKGPFERVELSAENPYGVREVYAELARCSSCGWGMHVSALDKSATA